MQSSRLKDGSLSSPTAWWSEEQVLGATPHGEDGCISWSDGCSGPTTASLPSHWVLSVGPHMHEGPGQILLHPDPAAERLPGRTAQALQRVTGPEEGEKVHDL